MRKLLWIPCLLFMLAFFALPVLAEESGDYEYTVENGEATIKNYLGSSEDVNIPSSIDGYPVTTIGYQAFSRNETLVSVKVPATVKIIDTRAFQYCKNLKKVTLLEGLEEIYGEVFRGCESLPTITIPASVSVMGRDAFNWCTHLKSITIKSGNKNYRSIDGVWYDKDGKKLILYPSGSERTEYVFPDSCEELGFNCFYQCDNLEKVTFPDRLRTIDTYCFVDCDKLKTAGPVGSGCNIEYEWTDEIPNCAFCNIETLTKVTFLSTITSIGGDALSGTGLVSVTVPGNVVDIDSFAFASCKSLKTVTLSSGVQVLGEGAFYSCTSLETISIPSSVTYIGWRAFVYCLSEYSYPNLDVLMYVKPDSYALDYAVEKGFRHYVAPKILTQPEKVKVYEGDIATMIVGAEGEDLNFQWYYKKPGDDTWTKVSSVYGESAAYSLTTAYRHNGYRYRCRISNKAGYVYTNSVLLTVIAYPPEITTQPKSLTVKEGETATFKVTATGSGITYQWYYKKTGSTSWTKVSSNGTSATYKLTTAARHSGYKYRCAVENNGGKKYTSTVTLTVLSAPAFTTQPKSATVYEGTEASFSIAATGGQLSYQWYYKKPGGSWTAVKNDGTGVKYTLTAELRHDGYQYRCRVKNAVGSAYSETVTLTVKEVTKPTVTKQPQNTSVKAGDTAKFTVTASGGGLSYQWYYKTPDSTSWTAVKKNGNSATYSLTAEDRHNGYKYRCKMTNNAGSVYSSAATLTIITRPKVVSYCYTPRVPVGYRASFKVEATGGDLHYQWYYMTPDGDSWTAVKKDGNSATYYLTAEARHSGYIYYCEISNAAGSVTTGYMELVVY